MNLQFFIWLEVQSLCQSAPVGGQHGGVEKKTPIGLTRPMGVATGVNLHAHPTDSSMQTRCQEKAPTDQPFRKPMGA